MSFRRWMRRLKGQRPRAEPAPPALSPRAQGDAARDAADWPTAANAYGAAAALNPDDAAIAVQWGHALKECGRLAEAEDAYRRASERRPDQADAAFQMAVLLMQTDRSDDAFAWFAEALRRDPGLSAARDALIASGRRDLLPEAAVGHAPASRLLDRLDAQLRHVNETLSALSAVSTYATQSYDAFRRAHPIPPPPPPLDGSPTVDVVVLVEARAAAPDEVRRTLTSLIDQRFAAWRVIVVAGRETLDHPVASFAAVDTRIRFVTEAPEAPAGDVLMIDAGVILDQQALGWLTYALARTNAPAVVCDHDHYAVDWRQGAVRSHPMLMGQYDRVEAGLGGWRGYGALFRSTAALAKHSTEAGSADVRDRISRALLSLQQPIPHLPLALLSLEVGRKADAPSPPVVDASAEGEPMVVIIPTRDQPQMLEAFVRSLFDKAASPDRLRLLILDNRSIEIATHRTLETLAAIEQVQVLRADAPFNWSRLNNQGVAASSEPLIVFANDDMEALTPGWDQRIRSWLARPEIGAVGARLLYPDQTVQHAGIVLGIESRPVHEGRHAAHDEAGPLDRWSSSRPVAAVTGAFLACRRETFDAVGGFDERLAIAYNDIDFCLRVRERNLRVLYAADVELTHHESKTRGHNDTPERIGWDDAELADLYATWGEGLTYDPARSPLWVGTLRNPYDGLRDAPLSRILQHLDAATSDNPWAVGRRR